MQAPEMPVLPLRDIKLPPEPGFWPLAPGWWVLIGLLLVLLVLVTVRWLRHQRKKNRWQQINQQLSDIEFSYQQHQNKQQLLAEVSIFLRRFVRFQLKQHQATTFSGGNWIEHLNQLQGSAAFTRFATSLTQGLFQAEHEYDVDGLLTTTRSFVKQQVMKPVKNRATARPGGEHV